MNILLLSNSAPNYFHFFNALAARFRNDGATVAVAVDSAFSRKENGLDSAGFAAVYDFSSFFVNHKVDFDILERYSGYNLNSALLSDFERAQTYGIWGNSADLDFFDRLKSALLTFFERIFEKHGTELVLYENVSNTFAHFALFVAQERRAVYIGLGASRLPGRFSVSGDPLADDSVERNFAAIRGGYKTVEPDVHRWVRDYIANIETIVPDYMKINGLERIALIKRYFRRDRLAKIKALLRHVSDSRTNSFQIGNPLRTYTSLFLRNVRRRLKAGTVRGMYQKAVAGERFLLYPMHFHPEASTSILAGTYLDEYEVIRNIAFSLPEGTRLYVKDHISAWAYPTLDFYRRIRSLPNVRLLGPHEPTKELIKSSVGVITLTSTVGYEALLLKKRVFLYGRVFYEFHKGVVPIANPANLRRMISGGLASPIGWDDQYNHDFVCAYWLSTLPGTLNLMLDRVPAAQAAEHIYRELLKAGLLHGLAAIKSAA
ncbi:hypothetical protein [Mesorhizobium sp. M1D.F.Ca.ET.043.01.1.1]|uniref:capsular polysaccharide export protein, LipB/KpsS family n=1 Tax=Mesorhizobium sp. M1D.F.Ca.ET.043.01.1.1 TaxID=2493669 RepID=UPI000F74F4BF|nr:hypothetical protein [Mesorhizobium sp. M1D.F.Ca.ET.043.01.1.1]AZO75662.1 hypothetical protein EJ067_34260 [Mesorhizobium sp. M1D.F.Ca.ET.043.01.1.1]